jgi:hypothetical protein
MVVLALTAPIGAIGQLSLLCFAMLMAFSGTLLARMIARQCSRAEPVGLLPGTLALGMAVLTLGVALTAFQRGHLAYSVAATQFLAALLGLALGAGALVVAGASQPMRVAGMLSPAAMVRDGLLLIVGTLLLAVGLDQLSAPELLPPPWNWASFFFIMVPGMLLLVAREGVNALLVDWSQRASINRVAALALSEGLLVVGLASMLYGGDASLILGMNGAPVHPTGNGAGLLLWGLAALALVIGRGAYKYRRLGEEAATGPRLMSKLLYLGAVLAFIVGERSVLQGTPPAVGFGGGWPVALFVLLAALLVLVPGRLVARRVTLTQPALVIPRPHPRADPWWTGAG